MNELSERQNAAIAALLSAGTVSEAAKVAGVPRRTLYKWLELPEFAQTLRAAECETIKGTSRRLSWTANKAAARVEYLIDDPDTPPTVQLRAAQIALDAAIRWRESTDLEERITALEAATQTEGTEP